MQKDRGQRMQNEREQLEAILRNLQERLYERQKQQALFSISADPVINIEIRQLQQQIEGIEQQIKELG